MDRLKKINQLIQDYTIVLCTRDYRRLGQLSKLKNINNKENLNSACEFYFSIYKYNLLKVPEESIIPPSVHIKIMSDLWNNIVDFKLIWVKELDKYYEIRVTTDDGNDTYKTITATTLCEAELSNLTIDSLEINTEKDILRDDYEPTTFYNNNHKTSLLHRVLADKAPHYSIKHVDESLKSIQRTFSVSGTSIHDFFTGEVSEQVNCLFQFDSRDRSISVYDLYTICEDCGYRGDYYDVCPKCNSKKLKSFGNDTTILIDKNNLTDQIRLNTNSDQIKNSLKLVAGDELMTATVRMLNQNGSDYIYRISDYQRNDMPTSLVQKLDEYDKLYNSYTDRYEELMNIIYQKTDDILYFKSGMMPTIEQAEINASTEIAKLTEGNLSPIGLTSLSKNTSLESVNSALINYARIYVKSGYVKISIEDGATFTYIKTENNVNYGEWKGKITVTNYSDEEDVEMTELLTLTVHDNYQEFISQKVLKTLAKDIGDEETVFDVLAIENLDKFKETLTHYSFNRLSSYYDSIQSALDILIQLNQGEKNAEFHSVLYVPYYNKLQACQSEMDVRQEEIDKAQIDLDLAESERMEIQKTLNLQTYLGDDFLTFCAYRRDDTYENSNYISDGLDNAEIIKRAKEFLEVARQELLRASEPEFTISTTLYNLLALDEFAPIVNYFHLGNWIRIKVDGVIYKLRLLSYGLNFDDIQNLTVEFSNVTKVKNVVHEVQQVIQSAKSMSTNFGYIAKQAEKGSIAKNNIENLKQTGLNSGLIQIMNNTDEEVIYDKHGLLCRSKDDVTGKYDDKQVKVTHNVIAFTDNNWKTVRQVLGEHKCLYINPLTYENEEYEGYGVTTDFVNSGIVVGSTMTGGKIFSKNYEMISPTGNIEEDKYNCYGTYIDLEDGTFSFCGKLKFKTNEDVNQEPELSLSDGIINAGTVIGSEIIGGSIASDNYNAEPGKREGSYIDLTDGSLDLAGGGLTYNKNDGLKIESEAVEDTLANAGILADKLKVRASNIDVTDGKIKSEQIESVVAENISGTLSSSQISETLTNKDITGSFNGNIIASSVTTVSDGVTYNTITGEFTIGNMTMKFVNGLLVSATPVVTS